MKLEQIIIFMRFIKRNARKDDPYNDIRIENRQLTKYRVMIDELESVRVEMRKSKRGRLERPYLIFQIDNLNEELNTLLKINGIYSRKHLNNYKLEQYRNKKRQRMFGDMDDKQLENYRQQIKQRYMRNFCNGRVVDVRIEQRLYSIEANIIDEQRMRAGLKPIYNYLPGDIGE